MYEKDDGICEPAVGIVDFSLKTLKTTENPYLDNLKRDLQNVENLVNKIQQISEDTFVELSDGTFEGQPNEEQNRENPLSEIDEVVPQKGKKGKKAKEQKRKPVLESCVCKQNCLMKISEERRRDINQQYWLKSYERRGDWLLYNVRREEIKRIRVRMETRKRERKCSYQYFLTTEVGEEVAVCQQFFLKTLGYKSNKKLVVIFNRINLSEISAKDDQRGKAPSSNKTSNEIISLIDQHIESANPGISHYRRKHAPNRLYLPAELSARLLFSYFTETHPELKVKYDIYRQRIIKKNISFAKLGLEECETCLSYDEHVKRGVQSKYANGGVEFALGKLLNNVVCMTDGCDICDNYISHKKFEKTSLAEYQKDKDPNLNPNSIIVATDMQKVIMLPRLPGAKAVIFTRRLTTYHMTFAPVGGIAQGNGKPVGIIWHEGIMGRCDEDVTSTFVKFIQHARDKTNILG